jgi:predicted RNA binding protein YcfA (HicA-like mRNA interferase family)
MMSVREIIKRFEEDGWKQVAHKGSHRQLKHTTKPGRVAVSGKLSDDVPKFLEYSILKQAGLR